MTTFAHDPTIELIEERIEVDVDVDVFERMSRLFMRRNYMANAQEVLPRRRPRCTSGRRDPTGQPDADRPRPPGLRDQELGRREWPVLAQDEVVRGVGARSQGARGAGTPNAGHRQAGIGQPRLGRARQGMERYWQTPGFESRGRTQGEQWLGEVRSGPARRGKGGGPDGRTGGSTPPADSNERRWRHDMGSPSDQRIPVVESRPVRATACPASRQAGGVMSEQPPVVERVNVSLVPDGANALAKLHARTGLKKVDIVNRALQLYEFVDAAQRDGNTLILRSPDGRDESVRFL